MVSNKKTKVFLSGAEVTLTYLKSTELPDFKKITSASIIPFLPDGRMVSVSLDRGMDIPGGHKEACDKNLHDILKRESLEEAGIVIENEIIIVQVILSDYYEDDSYMVIATGFVKEMHEPFIPKHESFGRKIVTVEEFLEKYDSVIKKEFVDIVLQAKSLLFS